jgi:hypothetical protein
MKFTWVRALSVVMMTVFCGFFSAPSHADLLCDGPPPAIWPYLPPLPKGCQRERIQAAGGLSYNIFKSAEKIAEAAWQREVLTKYGERFQDIKDAACRKVLCVKGSISGTRRCTISGFPCAADMDDQYKSGVQQLATRDDRYGPGSGGGYDGPPPGPGYGPGPGPGYGGPDYSSLSPGEIIELQRFLGVTPDGIFGGQSIEALRGWRRSVGLRPDGPPNQQDLEFIHRRR